MAEPRPTIVTCANCGLLLDEPSDVAAEERRPCPTCGSSHRVIAASGTVAARVHIGARADVEHGLNDLRLAVLGILVGIGLTVGFGIPGPFWVQAGAGLGAFAFSAFLIWWR